MPDDILLAVTAWDHAPWVECLRAAAPHRRLAIWPDEIASKDAVAYACVWKPPAGLLSSFRNLKVIFSLGAGVDHLLADRSLPGVPLVRVVDPDLTQQMVQYVVLHTLTAHRRYAGYAAQQRERIWRDIPQPSASDVGVGIMGFGELGSAAALVLTLLGFRVAGWARTAKTDAAVEMFYGDAGLSPFLARTDILIVLLPHTSATEGILNADLFRKLRQNGPLGGAHLINAGRGKLQVDADIKAALDSGILAGATLDVFPVEPLPSDSPLWAHPKVTITPHNAAVSNPGALVKNILAQITRFETGQPLQNVVDRAAGY
jgi:glyoxylate/hydroxypyruvate reductase A